MQPRYHLPRGGTQSASGLWLWRFAIEIPLLIASLWIATEYIAWRFHWHPNLGIPLWHTRLGNIYRPWEWIRWWWHYHNLAGTETWWHHAEFISAVHLIAPLISIAMIIRRDRQFGEHSDIHGSARWATSREIKRSGLYQQSEGVYIGGWHDGKRLHYLRHNGPEHIIAVAPTQSEKTVGLVKPTLLTYPHSVLVNDIKGELKAGTAGWRQQELGSRVIFFDPTCTDGTAAPYDPLLEVRDWPSDVKDVQNIALLLHDPNSKSNSDPYWEREGRRVDAGLMLHQLYAGRDKSLAGCSRRLSDPRQPVEELLREMLRTEHDPTGRRGWINPETQRPTRTHPFVAGVAQSVLNLSEKTQSGVISSARSLLDLYEDPIVAANTSRSDFSLNDLISGDQIVSVYLTTPPSDLGRTRPLFRLLVSQLGHRLMEETQGVVSGYRSGRRLLFMGEEFASLERVDFFDSTIAWAAGYGLQYYFIFQDFGQLRRFYGKESSILANCHVRVAFTPNDKETAEELSIMCGTQTVSRETRTYTGSRLSPWLGHVIASDQESQRPLLTVDELLTMSNDDALMFVGSQRPIYGSKIRYWQDAEFARRGAIAAPSQSDRIPFTTHPWTHIATPRQAAPVAREALQELGRAL